MRTWIRSTLITKKMIKTFTRIGVIADISRVDATQRNSVIAINIRISFMFLFRIIVTTIIIGVGTDIFAIRISL